MRSSLLSQAYIYSDVFGNSSSIWFKLGADWCQNNVSARWARGEDIHDATRRLYLGRSGKQGVSSNKVPYRLKQSPRQWYKQFDSFMIKAKYNRCEYDSCIYFKQNDDLTYLLLYLDDMLIAVRNKIQIQKLKAEIKKEFDMKNLGEAKKILGMEISWDRLRQNLAISRELYSQGVREIQHGRRKTSHHFFSRSLQIILQAVSTITRRGGGDVSVPYASAIGSLMNGMVCTRP